MPRDNQGIYSLPAGSLVNIGEDIVPSQHNPPLQDISQSLSDSLSRDGRGGMRSNLNMGGFRVTNVAPGVQSTDVATMAQVSSGVGVPIGTVLDFAGAAAPTGWLLCAGQELSRSAYADLFAVIGTAFGSASATTFTLPDLRGRVVAGRDIDSGGYADRLTTPNSRNLGATGGAQSVTLTTAQMPSHSHTGSTASSGAHAHTVPSGTGNGVAGDPARYADVADGTISTSSAGAHTHTMELDDTGGGEAHPNVQPTIVMLKIIKASNA